MLTLSNSLSFIRAPLAFLLLQESTVLRIFAIFMAMATDCIDGYIARRSQSVSRLGTILDPTMDKFFVYFALTVLHLENKITPWEMTAMCSRDIVLCLYGLIILTSGKWKTMQFRAIRWGKAATALQFIVLIGIVLGFTFPWFVFFSFFVMGGLAFIELFQTRPATV
jgi:phosphatidylglycerophosphate synthase